MQHEDPCESWLKVWKRRGIRAPHKPLLMLVALRHALSNDARLLTYKQWDTVLRPLLRKYTAAKSVHTEYPFWRLQHDEMWQVLGAETLTRRKSNTDPLKSELLSKNIKGGFTPPLFNKLKSDAAFRAEFIEAMMRYFPAVAHDELRRDIGLDSTTL